MTIKTGEELTFRSTKGASKQRRDLINSEISNLRDILPLPEASRTRLSQLQIMSLACCYVRKANYFTRLFGENIASKEQPFEFSQTLTGFMMIMTREGKLLYISDNIAEHLGHSMVDMLTQGDSIYDIIDKKDHVVVHNQLTAGATSNDKEEKMFFCRMNVSRSFRRMSGFGDHKVMHVRGHFVQPVIRDHYGNQPVFMALCSPLVTPDVKEAVVKNDTMSFQTVHGLDMKFLEINANGEHHLGFQDNEIVGHSWYEYIHPEDIKEAKDKHTQLFKSSRELGCMLTVRLLTLDGRIIWVNTVMYIRQPYLGDNTDPVIVCLNQVISEAEAPHFKLQSQLYSSHIARSPEFLNSAQGGSPSHTITHFAMEQERYNAYQASVQYPPEPVPLQQTSAQESIHNSMQNRHQNGSMHAPLPPAGQYSPPNNGNYSPSADDPKQILRQEILNRRQRKRDNGSPQEECKPRKVPKMPATDFNGNGQMERRGENIMVTASAMLNPIYGGSIGLRGGGFSGGGGGVGLMAPVADVPVFAQLGIKEEVMSYPEPCKLFSAKALAADFRPLTPPTPAFSVSSVPHTTQLTVDTSFCQTIVVPPSMLTPESSVSFSPSHQSDDGLSMGPRSVEQAVPSCTGPLSVEQAVPTLLSDNEDGSMSGFDQLAIKVDEKLLRPPPPYQCPPEALPDLDAVNLDSFFDTIVTPEQKQTLNQALDMVLKVTKLDQSPGDLLTQQNPGSDLGLSGLTSDQITNIMASLSSELLLDEDLLGEFMTVPSAGPISPDTVTGSPAASAGPMAAAPADDWLNSAQHIMYDIAVLNQLAAQSPSNGDDDSTL